MATRSATRAARRLRSARRRPAGALAGMVAIVAFGSCLGAPPAVAAEHDRYSIVKDCLALEAPSGKLVARSGSGYAATAGGLAEAEPFRMQAIALGEYLLYGTQRDFAAVESGRVVSAAEPAAAAEWTVEEAGGQRFTFTNAPGSSAIALGDGGELIAREGGGEAFKLIEAEGCPSYPEVEINATGAPVKGSPSFGEVSGLVEGHMHGMAFEFLGGRAHCGRPWHKYGAPYALVDCVDHGANGCAAALENALYGDPARCHDPVGWPTFKDWPHHKSLTHESMYYRWLERAWRGGLRVYVNLMVENRVLCELYPLKQNDCNEMKSVLLQIERIAELEEYIDAQSGGPGKGWFRIVRSPQEARRVINQGKLAVIQGMEVSEPFDCRLQNDFPTCSKEDIASWLDRLEKLGIRQLELVNKFDNGLTGVAGDSGSTGTLTNSGNFVSTGKFWDLEGCADPENHDHSPTAVEVHNDDQLIGNGLDALLAPGTLPVYDGGPYCNQRGLTTLGEFTIRQIMRRGMVFDPDHMSVIARDQAMNVVESKDYSGVISSHSWSTENTLPRIYRLGGIVTPYAGGSEGFVEQWRHLRDHYRSTGKQYWGVGYGADANGFGSQGGPRGADVPNPVSYPFRSFDGKVRLDRQVSGERVFDINTDGVAHYGLYPDWIEDLRMLAGPKIVRDLGRGAEAYLQMWERAEGIRGVSCRGWSKRFLTARGFKRLRLGSRPGKVLRTAGQPQRRTRTWRWCAEPGKGGAGSNKRAKPEVVAVFTRRGRVALVGSNSRKHRAEGVRPGMAAGGLGAKAEPIGGGLHVREARGGRAFVYVVRSKRVRAVAVLSAGAARSESKLRRYVKRAGLR